MRELTEHFVKADRDRAIKFKDMEREQRRLTGAIQKQQTAQQKLQR